ncbi:FAD-dependent oxidoreductase [Haliea sp. E17]|uniref:FAD-dependent oxidoreductase n=1 Tax=Haliea sp. E17 TaxID=3401576 RepID=UPI003AAB830D
MRRRQFLAGIGASAVASTGVAGPLLSRADVGSWDMAADVVVIGAGAAGICAAIEARSAGASVMVLELMPRPGGTSGLSDGVVYAGGGTFAQRALGIEDSSQAMYQSLAAAVFPYHPDARLRLYCEHSAGHLDWLRDQGVPFAAQPQAGTSLRQVAGAPDIPRGHVPDAPAGLAGQYLMQGLLARSGKLGAQLLTRLDAEQLVAEADGRIIGVVANAGGQRTSLRARRGVVLACGGFIQQREMVRAFAPRLHACSTPWGAAGDLGQGIRLGISAGAAALAMDEGFCAIDLRALDPAPSGLLVNGAGQRFIAEDAYAGAIGHAVAFEQRGSAWLITDAGSALPERQQNFFPVAESTSVGGLADQLDLPRGALQQTVAYYNRYAARGEDPQFGKTKAFLRPFQGPPYRAWEVSGPRAVVPAYTLGGLATDVDGAVLDSIGKPIEGLFAAGRTAAGFSVAAAVVEGLSLGEASFFGRRAGAGAVRSA